MARREDAFTLTELIVVMMLIAVLSLIALGFHVLAREQASDAAARSNIRVAVSAIEAYRQDTRARTAV